MGLDIFTSTEFFSNAEPIGWAIRGARIEVLARENPPALEYILFVAADLKLVKT